jgi:hypothetical protein
VFVPNPLPPEPPLGLSGRRQRLLERATLCSAASTALQHFCPIRNYLYAYVRREAVL